jgi:NAD(P)-dependent dehydrogenase (short-subunit alcohol dehydrogenase family)
MLLEGKNAIVYGAGGGIGSGVARTFAREGARVFLAGRTREPLEAVAAEIGDAASVAVVDALDEAAVEAHARAVASDAGSLDVSLNLMTRGDVQGTPLVDMDAEDLIRPVVNGLRGNFNTARAAARIMAEQGSGVILWLTSGSAKGAMPMMGGTGPADAATDTFMRYLAVETGPAGVRVVGIYTAGVAETITREKLAAAGRDMDPAELEAMLAQMTPLRRPPRVQQVADTAAFLASDRASGMTATVASVTSGLVSV